MVFRLDSYCNITYVDSKDETEEGRYQIGPHPYEVCLYNQHRRLAKALSDVEQIAIAIEEIGVKIFEKDHPKMAAEFGSEMMTITGRFVSPRSNVREIEKEPR